MIDFLGGKPDKIFLTPLHYIIKNGKREGAITQGQAGELNLPVPTEYRSTLFVLRNSQFDPGNTWSSGQNGLAI